MKLKSVKIANYKSFDDRVADIPLTDLTAFVGPNNSGKSSVLKALDLFFNYSKAKVNPDCFHNGEVNRTIEITVAFHGLDEEERKTFRRHLSPDGSLTIIQRIAATADPTSDETAPVLGAVNEDKHGITLEPAEPWLEYEKKPTKEDVAKWWGEELTVGDGVDFKRFCGLDEPPSPDEYQEQMERFWDAHSDIIPTVPKEGDSKVLGWKNKLKGNLPNYLFIPAVQTIEETTKVQRTNPFGLILNWLLGDMGQEQISAAQRQLATVVADLFKPTDDHQQAQARRDEIVREKLNQLISEQFDLKLDIEFEPPQVSDILLGGVKVFADDGYRSLLTEKGQGVQRSAVLTILRAYSELREELGEAPARNTIFGIEEPEIYLHPPIRRATFSLFRSMAKGRDQILYSTHDGYFVDVQYFDEIRLLRRVESNGDWRTTVSCFPIEKLVLDCKNRYKKDVDPVSLRERFRRFYDPTTNEGFFSKRVIIVEGETEAVALPIYFRALGYDIDREETCILHAGGKGAIDYLFLIFNELGIPTYVVVDGDAPIELGAGVAGPTDPDDLIKKRKLNRDLLTLIKAEDLLPPDEDEFPETKIAQRAAVWKNNFETQVHHPLPKYEEWKAEAKRLFGSDSKQLVGKYIAQKVVEDQETEIPDLVRQLCERIANLTWGGSCLMLEPGD